MSELLNRIEMGVEGAIREALARGELSGLKGEGKPIADIDDDDPNWWLKRKCREEDITVVPPHLEFQGDIQGGLGAVMALRDERSVRAAIEALNERIARFNAYAMEGPMTVIAQIDTDRVVERWRNRT